MTLQEIDEQMAKFDSFAEGFRNALMWVRDQEQKKIDAANVPAA